MEKLLFVCYFLFGLLYDFMFFICLIYSFFHSFLIKSIHANLLDQNTIANTFEMKLFSFLHFL